MKDKLQSFLEKTELLSLGIVQRNVSLRRLCTMQIGGLSEAAVWPTDVPSFCRLLLLAKENDVPYLVLGGGSNLIPGDTPFHGVVLITHRLQKTEISGIKIKAECGCAMNQLILHAQKEGLGGMECLYGIPGTVGGAVKMNAGAHGTEIGARLENAVLFSPTTGVARAFSQEELSFSYRYSLLQQRSELVLLEATFRGVSEDPKRIKAQIAEVVRRRRQTQPLDMPSAGSIFRRPCHGEIWRMVDACGLRGLMIGDAQISEKHAGFIVNRGHARTADVCRLIACMHTNIYRSFGVRAVPEVVFFHLSEEEKCHLPML